MSKRKLSQVPVGHFFQADNGNIWFKVDEQKASFIANVSDDGAIIAMNHGWVGDFEVESMNLTTVRKILKEME